MATLQLTRSDDEHRLYVLDGIGTLRMREQLSQFASAAAGDRAWRLDDVGEHGMIQAVDLTGTVVGRFHPDRWNRGRLIWSERELALRWDSRWKCRYVLLDGDDRLARFAARTWGRCPVRVEGDDLAALDRGLLLFATYAARRLASEFANTG